MDNGRKKILVIDDEETVRSTVARALRKTGYEVAEAASGREGLDLARSRTPDLVLCDIMMDEPDGFSVLHHLRSQPVTSAIPVILMTGAKDGHSMRDSMDLGADDFLAKPFSPDEVREAVHSRLQRRRSIHEQALRDSERHYRELLDSQDDGVITADASQRLTFVNPAFARILGRSVEELLGHDLREFLTDDQRGIFDRQIELRKQGVKSTYELNINSPDGERRVSVNATPQQDPDGHYTGSFAVLRDVTDRLRTEETLRLQASALAATTNGIAITDRTGVILWINPAFTSITGYESADAIGQTQAILDPAHQDPAFYHGMWATILRGKIWQGELLNRRKDGSLYQEEMTVTPLTGPRGDIVNFVAVKRDISRHKQNERELRASEESFRTLADNVPFAVARLDRDLRVVYGNRALEKGIGQPAPEEWHTAVREIFDTGKLTAMEFEIPGPEEPRYFESTLVPERSSSGEVEFVLAVTRDVTERKKTEKDRQMMELQLRQAQKLEAIGQLAAGIAHEINTPTQYVGDNTRFLKDAFDNIVRLMHNHVELLAAVRTNSITPELLQHTAEILAATDIEYLTLQIPQAIQETLEGIDCVTKIVRAMKEFSHPGGYEKSVANLNRAIESAVTVARNEWKYVAEVKLDLDRTLPMVPCFIGEFNQVILNLVVNAAHAIEDVFKKRTGVRGVITIQTRRDGDAVEVRVSDTGTGIAEVHRQRIFEPFFTTKEVGRGSGQGLAFVYTSIVKKHSGTVTFETEVDRGTTFIIRLPLNPQASLRDLAAVTAAKPQLNHEKPALCR